jgi:hypothetical protein
LLRLVCLALVAVLSTGCSVGATQYADPADDSEEVIDEDPADEEQAGPDETTDLAICVRQDDQVRAAYRPCEDEVEGYTWYFYPPDARIPAIDQKATGGTTTGVEDELTKVSPKGGVGSDISIETPSEWVEVCADKPDRVRVANNFCVDQQDGYGWYYIAIDGYVPAMGKKAENGTFRFYGGDTYRARQEGGNGVDAAIDYEEEVVDEE